jgi:regulator of protease activity HflC (stomatin/prohibitin superfamily)
MQLQAETKTKDNVFVDVHVTVQYQVRPLQARCPA